MKESWMKTIIASHRKCNLYQWDHQIANPKHLALMFLQNPIWAITSYIFKLPMDPLTGFSQISLTTTSPANLFRGSGSDAFQGTSMKDKFLFIPSNLRTLRSKNRQMFRSKRAIPVLQCLTMIYSWPFLVSQSRQPVLGAQIRMFSCFFSLIAKCRVGIWPPNL